MFGLVEKDDFNNLEKEVSKIRSELQTLKTEVAGKVTDSEETAKISAQNAQASLERTQTAEQQVVAALKQLAELSKKAQDDINTTKNDQAQIAALKNTLTQKATEITQLQTSLANSKTTADTLIAEIQKNSEKIKDGLSKANSLPETVERVNSLAASTEDTEKKIKDLFGHAMKRKSDIDDIHDEILGYDIIADDGKKEHVDGLKDELETAYSQIEARSNELSAKIDGIADEISKKHQAKLLQQSETFSALIESSEEKVTATNEKLAALLPGAMAAGLSAAFEKKKNEETLSRDKLEKTFRMSILGLIVISVIPFGIDAFLMIEKGKDIIQIINDTPKIIISTLPIYLPVLWLAYSTSKKVNLSKRLIEEYTHKAVLGNTYAGLSNQIETLKNEEHVKEELRTKLLFNILQVSAENPGKLITNYNKSDHPIMEALENSAKLSDSIATIAKIPGLSALAKKLTEKGEKILSEKQKKVEDGLTSQETLEEREEPSKEQEAKA